MAGFLSNLGSSLGNTLGTVGSSAKGMLTDGAGSKAVIFIPNPNIFDPDAKITDTATDKVLNDLNEAAMNLEDTLNGDSPVAAVTEKVGFGKKISNALGSAKDYVLGGLDPHKVGEEAKENGNFIKVIVQFNPKSIRFDSLNGKIQSMNGNDDASRLVQTKELLGRTKLSFELIFDDVDLMDSFMLQEVADMNVTKVVNKGWDMLRHKGNTFTVTNKMDTFMALLASAASQHVVFFWGKLTFRGKVTAVNNTYTMFNTSGNPVRGKMRLEITQDANNQDAFVYENKTWKKSYESVFTDKAGGGALDMLSKLGNNAILNI